jgi:hypothetical protein
VTSAFGGQEAASQRDAGCASQHSEMPANLLIGSRSNSRIFSECVLTNNANHLDFDSAIPKSPSLTPPASLSVVDQTVYLSALFVPLLFIPKFLFRSVDFVRRPGSIKKWWGQRRLVVGHSRQKA